jgi:hypothetical protein
MEIFAEVPETGVLEEDVIARTGSALRDAVRSLSEEWHNGTVNHFHPGRDGFVTV